MKLTEKKLWRGSAAALIIAGGLGLAEFIGNNEVTADKIAILTGLIIWAVISCSDPNEGKP